MGLSWPPRQEAVDLCRELAALNRNADLPSLGTAVNNLALRLVEGGRHAEAVAAAYLYAQAHKTTGRSMRMTFRASSGSP